MAPYDKSYMTLLVGYCKYGISLCRTIFELFDIE